MTQFRPDPKPEKKEKKKRKRIKSLSIKREAQNREYLKLRKIFLELHPTCEIKKDGCTGMASDIHHTKGRIGSLLTDIEHFQSCCRSCHSKHHG
jgi:hypothetical protein